MSLSRPVVLVHRATILHTRPTIQAMMFHHHEPGMHGMTYVKTGTMVVNEGFADMRRYMLASYDGTALRLWRCLIADMLVTWPR